MSTNRKSREMALKRVTGWMFIIINMATPAVCLMCYQCATTKSDGPCIEDFEGLLNTSKGTSDFYAKDCNATSPKYDRCMIETTEYSGNYELYNRDCHDGKMFSSQYNSPRFKDLPANNETTCDIIKEINKVVCYRFCATDFCNGPQPRVSNCSDTDEDGEECGAEGIFAGKGPMAVELLCSLVISLLVIGWMGST